MPTQSGPSKNSTPLSKDLLTKHQQDAITTLYEGNQLIVGNMGSGKTVIAASAIAELLDDKVLKRVLIVTTPKIANTVWVQEFDKWQHTQHITVSAATGTPQERTEIITGCPQVVVVTFNTLSWMKKNELFDNFDGLLIDETTKLKTTGGEQFKALRHQLKKFKWRGGLTGTPVSEDFIGLFGQMLLIDLGKALGTRKESFLIRYFYPTDYKQYNWALKEGSSTEILEAIKPLVHVVPDYRSTLPPVYFYDYQITPPDSLKLYYDQMRSDMVTDDAISQTAAVLVQKLQQIASGFVYDEMSEAVQLSDYRVTALKKLLDKVEGNVLIAYWYKEDLERLREALPNAEELNPRNLTTQVARWNAREIKHLLIHPRSAGHGLQLEQGGNTLIWYTPQWSNDLWEQTNARIWRKGQTQPVSIYTMVATDTIDELITQRVENKAKFETLFNEHLGEKKMKHLPIGGSTIERYLACPGWIALAEGMPRSSSSAADRGNLLHDAMEIHYKEGKTFEDMVGKLKFNDQTLAHSDIAEALEPARLAMESLLDAYRVEDMMLEPFVECIPDLAGGSIDLLGISQDGETLVVADYKFGSRWVSAESRQLIFYAMCALTDKTTQKLVGSATKLVCAIIQPEQSSEPIVKEYDLEEVITSMGEALGKAMDNSNHVETGKHCAFCPAAPRCPEKKRKANSALLIDPKDAEQLSQALDLADELEAWIKQVRETSQQVAEQGGTIPHYKLVAGRSTRKWNPDADIKLTELLGDKAHVTSLIGITAAEKLLGKATLNGLEITELAEGKPKFVHESAKGDPIKINTPKSLKKLVDNNLNKN